MGNADKEMVKMREWGLGMESCLSVGECVTCLGCRSERDWTRVGRWGEQERILETLVLFAFCLCVLCKSSPVDGSISS